MAEALTEKMQPPAPLVALTDDEQMFRDNVRQFADEKVRPLVRKMDEEQVFDKDLIREFFELGLIGIEIPEQYGGGSGTFFEAILAVEEISRVDASAGVPCANPALSVTIAICSALVSAAALQRSPDRFDTDRHRHRRACLVARL